MLFDNFTSFDINCGDAVIHGVTGGNGPPLLLLHGYPQTHAMWHKVAPSLAKQFTVVAADLRGYGRSSKPETDARHQCYSKREMANDMITVMKQLGHTTFDLIGHDRGGRVAHRLTMDHPDAVKQLAVLDIAPTREMYRDTSDEFARAYWHWFFLIQPSPLPETMINSNPELYLRHKIGSGKAAMSIFSEAALDDYLNAWKNPATVHAACEDYRAAASIDIEHDNEDGQRKLGCPLLVLWGEQGVVHRCFDPLKLWKERAVQVSGRTLPCGHYIAEELPDVLVPELMTFLADD